ncbi:3-oxoacyl-ACP synthase III family protein [Hymenobacter rubripertinctus]|uniref:3-ketoacyl-ACP synthase n=1 Tax=Hymenobacter rubripertinctus TaxID=2029981 RepID=A0A418QWI5_9BACT|nr:3-oxoacyl-ACP synthase III family protein [Hymenobacter rubripertinctus]RIY09566.1 3-ketoacyl-ACP synthase [Hymenobacter rubripertinctus]
MLPNAAIRSLAIQMPSRHVRNDEEPYASIPDIPHNWWRFWGIKARYLIDREQGETAETLAVQAAEKALAQARLRPQDIDLILCNSTCFAGWSTERSKALPRFAQQLKIRLGCVGALAIDVEQECITFLISLQMATHYIASGQARHVLVCASEYISGVLDFSDLSSTTFGDGAAVAVVSADSASAGKLLASSYASNADFYDLATVKWRYPVNGPPQPEQFWSYFTLDRNAPAEMQKFVPEGVPAVVRKALAKAELTPDDIDFYVFHQPSKILVSLWANNLGVDEDRFLLTLGEYGCMVSVSMPVTLYEALRQGLIKPGNRVVIAGAATGWGFGAQVWEVGPIQWN